MPISDYNKKKPLEVSSTNDSGTTQDKAQPILVTGGDDSTTGTGDIVIDFTNIADEQDIAVYDENGNLLDYEIESLDTSAETGVIWAYDSWVRDDTVQAQVAYGDNSANTDRQNVTATWNNTGQNASRVYHQDPSDTESVSGNSVTVTGTTSESLQFNGSKNYDGSDDTAQHGPSVNFPFTVSMWLNPDNLTGTFNNFVASGFNFGNDEGWIVKNDGDNGFQVFLGDQQNIIGDVLSNDTTALVHVTVDSNGNIEVFEDNSSLGTASGSNSGFDSTVDTFWGSENGSKNYYDGGLDETKIHSEVKDSAWRQAEFDASPKAGQVYFSQQAAETVGTTFDGTTNTASASVQGKIIDLSGTTTAKPNTATASGTGNIIFLEAEFVTLTATASATGGTTSLAGTTTMTVFTAEASGGGGTSTLTQIIQVVSASTQAVGQTVNFDRLTGTVDVEGQAKSGVDVNVVDKTNNILYETTTDSNGNWIVDSGDGILYQVAYLFDDGTTFFGDAEESDTT